MFDSLIEKLVELVKKGSDIVEIRARVRARYQVAAALKGGHIRVHEEGLESRILNNMEALLMAKSLEADVYADAADELDDSE